MTTRDKGITLPTWANVRFTGGYFEVSSLADFSSNASYKYSYDGISPITQAAPVASAPQSLNIKAQDSNASFAAPGASVNLTPGVGSAGNKSGNIVIKDTVGTAAAWNQTHIELGSYHLWIDSTSRLRIKSSAPVLDTDGAVVSLDLSASTIYDPPNLVDGAGTTTTITVAGAVLGDIALAGFNKDLQGISMTAYVSSANTVSIRFQNESGGTLDLASGTLTVKVIKA